MGLMADLPEPEVMDAEETKLQQYQADPAPAVKKMVDSPIGKVEVGSLAWGVEQMRSVQKAAHAQFTDEWKLKHESHYKPKNFTLQRKFGRTMPAGWEPPRPEVRPEDVEWIELFEGVFGTDVDWLDEAVAIPEDGPSPDELRRYHWAVYRTRQALRLRYPEAFLDLEAEPAILEQFEAKPQQRRYRPTGKTCPKCEDPECWMHYDEQNELWLCFVCGKEMVTAKLEKTDGDTD